MHAYVITLALLPIFFLSKNYLFAAGMIIALAFWIISSLVRGSLSFDKNYLLASLSGIVILFGISAILSPAPALSFVGTALYVDTAGFMAMVLVCFFLGSDFFKDAAHAVYLYCALFMSFAILTLVEIIGIFFPVLFVHLPIINNANLSGGGWGDIAVFYGFASILLLATLELLALKKSYKIVLGIALGVSLFFVGFTNSTAVWSTVLALGLMIFLYILLAKKTRNRKTERMYQRFPTASFIVVTIAIFFVLANSVVGGLLSDRLHVDAYNVRPPVRDALVVTRQAVLDSPLFGIGPNRWGEAWSLYKPKEVNNGPYWNMPFGTSFGLIPTFVVGTGILGLIGWMVFLALFFFNAKNIIKPAGNHVTQYISISSFAAASYLWIILSVYNPGTVAFILAILFSSVSIASSSGLQSKPFSVNFLDRSRKSLFAVVLSALLLVLSIAAFSGLFKGALALAYFDQAMGVSNASLPAAENLLLKSISLSGNDLQYRSLSEVYRSELHNLISTAGASPSDAARSSFQSILQDAEQSAQLAVKYDQNNPENWIELGNVYDTVVPFDVAGAYDNARKSYAKALSLSPASPEISMLLARLEFDDKNPAAAIGKISDTLALKPDFSDALVLRAQIEQSENDTGDALTDMTSAAAASPYDASILFSLGQLRYAAKDYAGAAEILERAVGLSPEYLDARYALALSYDHLTRINDEQEQLAYILSKLPDDKDIQKMIDNLKNGKPAIEAGNAARIKTGIKNTN